MDEPVEQMITRLADQHLKYFIYGHESCGIYEFARACMLEQAKNDAEICQQKARFYNERFPLDGNHEYAAYACADAILKEANLE